MLQLFKGHEFKIAAGNPDGSFRPVEIDSPYISSGKFQSLHLSGRQCLGFYLCNSDWAVWCSCLDLDNKDSNPDPEWKTKTEEIYGFLVKHGVQPLVEISQSGNAAHIWMFFSEPIHARKVRRVWKLVSSHTGVKFNEIYPRSDAKTGKGLGNLVRFPLWGKSRFVDVENDWSEIDPTYAVTFAERVNEQFILDLTETLGGVDKEESKFDILDNGIPERVQRLLSKPGLLLNRWKGDTSGLKDPSRSGLVMSISNMLVKSFVPTREIFDALRIWGVANGCLKVERDDWLDLTISKSYEFATEETCDEIVSVDTVRDASIRYVDGLASGPSPMISTGVWEVDERIGGGLEFGEMVVVAARPSHGKSAFACQLIDSAAGAGYPGLFVSLEMKMRQLAHRHIQRIVPISEEDWIHSASGVKRSIETHHKDRAPVYVCENAFTIEAIENVVRQSVASHGVRVVVVDYIQLVKAAGATEYEQVTDASKRLTRLGKELNVVMVICAQISRSGETDGRGKESEPKLRHLKGSGQIEQDADCALLAMWDWRAGQSEDPEEFTIFAAKCRNRGIRGDMKVKIRFNAEKQLFYSDSDGGMISSEFVS